MKRAHVLPRTVGLVIVTAVLAGCHLPAAPDVTPTPSEQDLIEEGMAQLGVEAAEYSATLTAVAQSPIATPTTIPTVEPTAIPTVEPTAVPTVEPTPIPTTVAQPTAVSREIAYVVQLGENLFRIAKRYGLHYRDLAAYNNIVNPHRIFAGQIIRIPTGDVPSTTPCPDGDVLYTVRPGDNLFRIALRHNLNYRFLASYNGISNPHQIYVGQVIRIPTSP